MSRNEINLREARARIGYLVERAEHTGEITIITRHGHPAAAIVPIHLVPQEPAMTITASALATETGATYAEIIALADQLAALDGSENVVASEDDGVVSLTAEAAEQIREQLGAVTTYVRTREEGDGEEEWGDDVITLTQRGNEVTETSHVDGIDGKDSSGFADEFEAAEHIRSRGIDLEADGYTRA